MGELLFYRPKSYIYFQFSPTVPLNTNIHGIWLCDGIYSKFIAKNTQYKVFSTIKQRKEEMRHVKENEYGIGTYEGSNFV